MTPIKWLVAVVVALAAAGAIYFVLPKDEDKPTASDSTSQTASDSTDTTENLPENTNGTFTAAQVAEHNSESDCWTIINGDVYNLTSFISDHPGGEEILRACGQDATTFFNNRETPGGEEVGSGTPHSDEAKEELAKLRIGSLAI